ncbi:MAG: hypothetical protein Q9180_009367 [Flavoplaca navasiana]
MDTPNNPMRQDIESNETASKPQISLTTPNQTSIPKATPTSPIPNSSNSDKFLAKDDDDDNLPDRAHLVKTSLPTLSTPAPAKPTDAPNLPLSPPTTPAKFHPPAPNIPSTIPQTPHRGLRPTRGVYPTPPQSRKRALSPASRALDNQHAFETSPMPSKRIQRSIYLPFESKIGSPPAAGAQISRFEAQRVSVSIMKQVDWDRVAERVACNRSGRVYRRAVEGLLDGWQEGLEVEVGVGESEG